MWRVSEDSPVDKLVVSGEILSEEQEFTYMGYIMSSKSRPDREIISRN